MTDATVEPDLDLRARQLAAIEESGWGERFRLVQPRNPLFWVYSVAVAVGVVRAVSFYRPEVGSYGGALAVGVVIFAIYTIPWAMFLHWLDRYSSVQPRLLVTGFVWGAVVATTYLALTVNGAVLSLYTKGFGQAWASDWAAGGTAPLTEETAKALGFVVLLGLAPRLIRSAFDAFVIGAFIGLGFQVAEDVLYVYQGAARGFGAHQTFEVVQMVIVRGLAGIVSHALFSAIVCTGLIWIIGSAASGRHVLRGLACIAFAAVAHGSWDATSPIGRALFGDAGLLVTPIIAVIEIVGVLYVARLASSNERRWVREVLAPEAAAGVITDAELDAVSGSHRDERRYVKTVHGHGARKTTRHVLDGIHELAAAIGSSRGEEDEDVAAARAEIDRLRTL